MKGRQKRRGGGRRAGARSSLERRDERAALRIDRPDAGLEHVQRRRREEDPRPDDDRLVRRRLGLEALGGLRPRPLRALVDFFFVKSEDSGPEEVHSMPD